MDAFDKDFPFTAEEFLPTVAQILMSRGEGDALNVLTESEVGAHLVDYDKWNDGTWNWGLVAVIGPHVYAGIQKPALDSMETAICAAGREIFRRNDKHSLTSVTIAPKVTPRPEWREDTRQWLKGAGVSNQGRLHATNVVTRAEDGLLFRSRAAMALYRALKDEPVTFAPLPVFLRGGDSPRRVEPDFVLIQDGIDLVVELEGDAFHAERPSDADTRLALFKHEGVHIERVPAADCDTDGKARETARRLLALMKKYRAQR